MNVWGDSYGSPFIVFDASAGGYRFKADFSNAVIANRFAFQTSVANSSTVIPVLPNGTSQTAAVGFFSSSTPANSSTLFVYTDGIASTFNSTLQGSGSILPFSWQLGGVEAMRLDTAGRLGVGTVPYAFSSTYKSVSLGGSVLYSLVDGTASGITANLYFDGTNWKYAKSAAGSALTQINGTFQFFVAPVGAAGATASIVESMRLDNNGNLYVGGVSGAGTTRLYTRGASTTSGNFSLFVENSAGTSLFSIRCDGVVATGIAANSPYNFTTAIAANLYVDSFGTLFRSTSSLRYKTDVKDYTRGLETITQLRPVTFRSNNPNSGDPRTFAGFIAEEFDALNLTEFVEYRADDGSPDAIHYANITALLVSGIKQLVARIESLEAKAA